MLKTTGLLDELASGINYSSKLAFSKNNSSKLVFENNEGDIDNNKFSGDDMKYAKKSEKTKAQKLLKSKKLSKSRKMLLKSENLPNFGIKKAKLNFLTSNARKTFNCLWLIFTKAPIL